MVWVRSFQIWPGLSLVAPFSRCWARCGSRPLNLREPLSLCWWLCGSPCSFSQPSTCSGGTAGADDGHGFAVAAMAVACSPRGGLSWLGVSPLCLATGSGGRCSVCVPVSSVVLQLAATVAVCSPFGAGRGSGVGGVSMPVADFKRWIHVGAWYRAGVGGSWCALGVPALRTHSTQVGSVLWPRRCCALRLHRRPSRAVRSFCEREFYGESRLRGTRVPWRLLGCA